jgi:hypothetical protein
MYVFVSDDDEDDIAYEKLKILERDQYRYLWYIDMCILKLKQKKLVIISNFYYEMIFTKLT